MTGSLLLDANARYGAKCRAPLLRESEFYDKMA